MLSTMSKGKKGSKTTPEAVGWDEGLISAAVQEDDWRACLVFVSPKSPDDEPHVRALAGAVDAGTRRRFTVVDKTTLLQSAAEDAKLAQSVAGGGGKKSKAGAVPPQRPMFVEVCEQVVDAMKSSDPLPPSLLAKMIKYKVLREKAAHRAAIAQKEAEEAAKVQATKKGGEGKGGKGGGRGSKAAGKKGKETPAVDADPAIPLPEKPPVSMKKRGEEDTDSKYIDDEPADGPTCYIVMIGFSSIDLLEQLSPIGLTAHVLININGGSAPLPTDEEEEGEEERKRERERQECDLAQFWGRLGECLQATSDGHMLRDMAQVNLRLPQPLVPPEDGEEKELYGQSLFDAMSRSVYRVLEQREQYHHYLHYLRLRQLSPPACGGEGRGPSPSTDLSSHSLPVQLSSIMGEEPHKVDLRLYNELLSSVPPESTTVPLMLHCILEQLCATLNPEASQTHTAPAPTVHSDVLAEISNFISGLCIPTTEKKALLPKEKQEEVSDLVSQRGAVTIEHWNTMGQRSRNLSDSKLVSGQTNTNNRALLQRVLAPPRTNMDERNAHLAMLNAVQHHCTLASMSERLLNHSLLTLSLERVSLPSATSPPHLSNSPPPPLLFDYPLNILLKESRVQASGAVVPYRGAGSATVRDCREQDDHHELNLPPAQHPSLTGFSVCEPMSRDSLLQHLQSLRTTHPYLSVFTHRLSESTVAVASSGFDGQPLHTYTWQSLAHSRVGFNNYLQYVAEQCGEEVDRAVEKDQERREAFENERQKLVEAREKALKQQPSEKQAETEAAKDSAKVGKKSSTSSPKKTPNDKRSKADVTCPTPEPDKAPDKEANVPEFDERKLYEAYDVGDRVLLKRGTVSVQFLGDGSQVITENTENLGQERIVTVSAVSNGHSITCSMTKEDPNNSNSKIEESEKRENQEADTGTEGGDQLPTGRVVAGIPQPPLGVKFSSITAQFRDSLRISLSQFGPGGNGELPFQPVKPEILLEIVTTDGASSSSESRPQSQQTQQKMGKKQMEQQQQLLEQQRQLEEQKRAEAQADFDARCSALQRQNKYQQLFASTPYGLHVHLQVDVDLEADPETTDGSDGRIVVRQSYPAQGPRRNIPSLSLATRDEVERYCLPDGSVLCFLRDGSVSVLCPDGHVYHTATQSLSDIYQQTLNDSSGATDSHKEENQRNEEHLTQPTYSDTKVTFADQLMDRVGSTVQRERKKLSQMVWVVTTPSGQRYLWRCPTPAKPTHQTQEKGESEAAPALGEAETDPDGTSNTTTPQQQQQEEKQGGKIVTLPPAQLVSATDPVTKQVLLTREDNVTLLECPDGSFVAEHADGTRITTTTAQESDSTLPYEILIECPGFARVTHTATKQSLVEFPDGSTVVGSTSGKYTVGNKSQYKLKVEPSGEALCCLQPADSTAYSFTLDHTGTGNILIAKAKKSKVEFSVDRDGVPSVSGSGAIPLHPAFSPRYFVVPSSGSPYQILSKSGVDSYLSEMESQPDTTIIKGEAVPGFEGTTIAVMTNLKEENPAIMPYKNGSIVPENLSLASPPVNGKKRAPNGKKRFGVGVGKSLHILPITHAKEMEVKKTEAPKTLRCRQFVILDQFDETSRDQVCKDLASYISWRHQQGTREDDLLPVDPRDLSEIRAAQQLKSRWLNKTTGNILSSALLHVQQSSDPTGDGKQKEQGENSTEFLNGIRCDLEESERNRIALRNHTVPQYFDSDSGREYLRSQSPDMTALAKQLAQPRVRQAHHPPNNPSHSSTPSSLQSTSIILQPDGGVDSPLLQQPGEVESPDMGDIDTASVSSTNKLRPTHPTPDHARGLCSPTDVRPNNPTPFGADRQTHSPAPSLISNTPGATPQEMVGGVVDEQQGERSVSFILPPRRSSLIVGESSPDHPELQRGSKPHNTVKDATRRKVRTCSTMGVGSGVVRGLEAMPQSLDFGTVQEGCSYARSLVLKNVGIDPCRFRIKQPPPSTGIRVIYTPGPVAAGMTRKCEVELFAIAVGVVGRSGTGRVSHSLEVVSETNTLHVPILAAVLTDRHNSLAPAEGVRQIQRPSSSREDYTRPRTIGTK